MKNLSKAHSIRRLAFSSACGAIYNPENMFCIDGWLRGGEFNRSQVTDRQADTVALEMEHFVFRLVDIPPGNRKVLEGQLGSFLPFASRDIIWQVMPVGEQSFLLAIAGEKWREIEQGLRKRRRRLPFVIPSLIAAMLYHLWRHDGNGALAVPAGDRFLIADMAGGGLQKIEYCDTIENQDAVVYDKEELIASGAALYSLIPHDFEGDLIRRKPFPKLFRRTIFSAVLACSLAIFFIFSVFQRDMARLDLISGAIADIKKESTDIERIISRNQKIEDTAEFVQKVNNEYISPYLVLGDISSHLGDKTHLIDFFLDGGKGRMTGVSKDVTGMLVTISNRPYMKNVEFTTPIVRDNEGNERFQLSFRIDRQTGQNKENKGP